MMKILIIDNNLTFGEMLADILKTSFSSSVICLRGDRSDILDRFNVFSPDIIFIDVQSMEKDCTETAKSFKAFRPDSCVIWVTSCNQPEYVQKARDSGIDYCLLKDSMTIEGIINLIRMVHRP